MSVSPTDIEFLKASPTELRSALDHEMLREIAASFPELHGKCLEGWSNWADYYLNSPWESSPNVSQENDVLDRRIEKHPLDFWNGRGLTIERAGPYNEKVEMHDGGTVTMTAFRSRELQIFWPDSISDNEVQFVFRFRLDAPRAHIEKAFRDWFKLFRRNYPPPRVGAPRQLAVARYELAVVRLKRAGCDVLKIIKVLLPYDSRRAQKLSKGEVGKICQRVKERVRETRDELIRSSMLF